MGFAIGPLPAVDLIDGHRGHCLVLGVNDDGMLMVLTEVGNLEYRDLIQVIVEMHYDERGGMWREDFEETYAPQETDRDPAIPGPNRDPHRTSDRAAEDRDPRDLDPAQGPDQA